MRLLTVLLLSSLSLAASASAGTIVGTVRARGAETAPTASGDGAYASRRYKFVERLDYDQLRDFVVPLARSLRPRPTR